MGVRVHGLHTPARYGQLAAFASCHADLRRMESGLDQTAAADEYSGRCGRSARDIFQEVSAIWHCLLLTLLPSPGSMRTRVHPFLPCPAGSQSIQLFVS